MFFNIEIIIKIISLLYSFIIFFFCCLYYVCNDNINKIIQRYLEICIYWKVSFKRWRIYRRFNGEYRFDFRCKCRLGSEDWQFDVFFERLYNEVDVLISVVENCLFLNNRKKVWKYRRGCYHYNECFSDIHYDIHCIYIFINNLQPYILIKLEMFLGWVYKNYDLESIVI